MGEIISRELAERAHAGTSHTPERRAEHEQEQHRRHLAHVYQTLQDYARSPEQQEILDMEFDRFRENYIERVNNLLATRSRIISPMVTGPANFPARQQQKAQDSYARRMEEFSRWERKAKEAIIKKIKKAATPDQVEAKIRTELKKSVARTVATLYEMKNGGWPGFDPQAFRRSTQEKIKRTADNGHIEAAREALKIIKEKQKEYGITVFAPNNSVWVYPDQAEAKQEQARQEREARQEAQGDSGDEEIIQEFNEAQVIRNHEDDRVQIFFDEKPDADIRQALKSKGFKWAPSVGAWQRKLTENAERDAVFVLKHTM